jgi:hypothetical protein
MSDRKYRQRGYQDAPRERGPKGEKRSPSREETRVPGGRPFQDAAGPRTPNLMASHEVFRCARCGNRLALPVESGGRCPRCGIDLHACIQCASFDTSARFECVQPVPARVAPKDAQNACAFFSPRTTIERQTGTQGPQGSTTARQAFDDLFKS